MRKLLLLLLSFVCLSLYSQANDIYEVCYVDSITSKADHKLMNVGKASKMSAIPETMEMRSMRGKIIIRYDVNEFMTEGVLRNVLLAANTWEGLLDIKTPIAINLKSVNEADESTEIKTTVLYSKINDTAYPLSFYKQVYNSQQEYVAKIEINASIDWASSWENDNSSWGHDNLTTALLRHFAHVFGFGTSIVARNGVLNYTVSRRFPSQFDKLITDGTQKLTETKDYENYFKRNLYVSVNGHSIKLYTSPMGFVPYRTACYLSNEDERLMGYPYGDKSRLLPIDNDCLEIMSAIGWKVMPHDLTITGNGIDAVGYGSNFSEKEFRLVDSIGDAVQPERWNFQTYDGKKFVDVSESHATTFRVNSDDMSILGVDTFGCAIGKVSCLVNKGGIVTEYSHQLTLDCHPSFLGYKIENIVFDIRSGTYSFDLSFTQEGAKILYLIISSEYGTILDRVTNAEPSMTIHVDNALSKGNTYIDLVLENEYGSTDRYLIKDIASIYRASKGFSSSEVKHPEYVKVSDIIQVGSSETGITYKKAQ